MVVQKKILTREFTSKVMRYENGELVERAYTSNAGVLVGGTPGQIVDTSYKPVAHTFNLRAATKIGSFVEGQGIVVNAPEYALYGTQRMADESGVTIGGPIYPNPVLPKNMVVTMLTAGRVWVERGELETIKAGMNAKVIYEPDGDDEKDLCIVEVNGVKPPPFWGLTFTANEPGVVVNMDQYQAPNIVLEYSTDNEIWKPFDANNKSTPITLENVGDKVFFRAGPQDNTCISGGNSTFSKHRRFTLSGSVSASGNIMSLLTRNENVATTITMDALCFACLFIDCTSLTTAPELPATTLARSCYSNMFYGCTSLTTAPAALPATILPGRCYQYMFQGCTSLTSAPELLAKNNGTNACENMFSNCSSLSSISVNFTDWGGYGCYNWLSNVAAEGTFTCPEELDTTTRDASHVPAGWTVVTKSA